MASCGVCIKTISKSQVKLSCIDCNRLFHGTCVKMSKSDIETLNTEGISWRCDPCASARRRSMRLETQAEQGKLTLEDVMQAINEMKENQSKLVTDFNTSYELMNTKLDDNIAATKEQTRKMNIYLERMEKMEAENALLKERLATVEGKLEEMEQYSRRNCVEIQGVPEDAEESIPQIVQKLGNAVGMDITSTMIDACHRLGKRANGQGPRGIIVRFVRRLDKEELMMKKRQKKNLSTRHMDLHVDNPVYINESLTPSRRKLFAVARQVKKDKSYAFVWHRGGKIYLKKDVNGPVINVNNQDDLSKL